jgi:lysophospholipase L1-like esterase
MASRVATVSSVVAVAVVAAVAWFAGTSRPLLADAVRPAGMPSTRAQDDPRREVITSSLNAIDDPTGALSPIFARLRQIESSGKGKLTVFQVGDSHVEAGFFAEAVRSSLGRVFGYQPRGFVVPKYRRRVVVRRRVQYVATSLETPQAVDAIEFTVALKDSDPSAGFDTLVFVHEKGPQCLDFLLVDSDNRPLAAIKAGEPTASVGTSIVHLTQSYRSVKVRTIRSSKTQKFAQLYGISLESDRPGVVFHSFGVIGAAIDNYLKSSSFPRQLDALQPDLVVVSLGTNDAFAPNFDAEAFRENVRQIVALVRERCPRAVVMLTTAGDAYKRAARTGRRSVNENVGQVRRVILEMARPLSYSTWDLFAIMGGSGSIALWREHGLATTDMVHFTRDGYDLQGVLFSEALLSGFRRYATTRPGEDTRRPVL